MASRYTKLPIEAVNDHKHHGVVVPMVTPVNGHGALDEPAVDRLVDFLLAGRVNGVFVLGTTGEGTAVPHEYRRRIVERTAARVRGRAKVYAGLGGLFPHEITSGNQYLRAGADAIVAHPPQAYPVRDLPAWFGSLLDGLEGPLIIYNIPQIAGVSIPLEQVGALAGHPNLIGIKDSENNPKRLEELMARFGGREDFTIFVGVGALMARGLKLGAHGIVPSVGNLIPEVCHQLYECARARDWTGVEQTAARMNSVAALYQGGRTLGESLAALKAALHVRGLCSPNVLPPLNPINGHELDKLRNQMGELRLLS
ncbi:MAG: dihydrodipicolinate synthase family protein [Verrucomicrobia bacterium]|nr:MAG: dihydrodipicolinate synthase family protein [Verrucomicrobiota bacterium]